MHAPAPAAVMTNTIGAGDTFGAALVAWLIEHARLSKEIELSDEETHSALEFANRTVVLLSRVSGEPRQSGNSADNNLTSTALNAAGRNGTQ